MLPPRPVCVAEGTRLRIADADDCVIWWSRNEALRLYPPVLSAIQHRTPSKGVMISGRYVSVYLFAVTIHLHATCVSSFIPPNTQVSVHHYTLQRSPAAFAPFPDIFWPDRWLTQETYELPPPAAPATIPKDKVVTDKSAFIPFSAGQQNCAGRSLAIMEMRAVLCALVQRFEFDVAPGEGEEDVREWERQVKDVFLTMRGRLRVRVRVRE